VIFEVRVWERVYATIADEIIKAVLHLIGSINQEPIHPEHDASQNSLKNFGMHHVKFSVSLSCLQLFQHRTLHLTRKTSVSHTLPTGSSFTLTHPASLSSKDLYASIADVRGTF
jgi:hypothetical protein